MATSPKTPEAKFSIEARELTPAQLDAGRRFFGQLLAKTRADQTSASSAQRKPGHVRERGQREMPEQPDTQDPPHLLTGGSQTP